MNGYELAGKAKDTFAQIDIRQDLAEGKISVYDIKNACENLFEDSKLYYDKEKPESGQKLTDQDKRDLCGLNKTVMKQFNDYFKEHQAEKDTDHYKQVQKAYKYVSGKFYEDALKYGTAAIDNRLLENKELLASKHDDPHKLAWLMAERTYLALIKYEYLAAEEAEQLAKSQNNVQAMEEAKNWKREILSDLTPENQENAVNNFIMNYRYGNAVYNSAYSAPEAANKDPNKFLTNTLTNLAGQFGGRVKSLPLNQQTRNTIMGDIQSIEEIAAMEQMLGLFSLNSQEKQKNFDTGAMKREKFGYAYDTYKPGKMQRPNNAIILPDEIEEPQRQDNILGFEDDEDEEIDLQIQDPLAHQTVNLSNTLNAFGPQKNDEPPLYKGVRAGLQMIINKEQTLDNRRFYEKLNEVRLLKKAFLVETKHALATKYDEKLNQVRVSVEESLVADERKLGVYEKDHFYEDIALELEHAREGLPQNSIVERLIDKLHEAEELNISSRSAKERLKFNRELSDMFLPFFAQNIQNAGGPNNYRFSMNGGQDGKPVEPQNPYDRLVQSMLIGYQKVADKLLEDTAEFRPNQLDRTKELLRGNEQKLGTHMNLGIEVPAKKINSVKQYNDFAIRHCRNISREINENPMEDIVNNKRYGKIADYCLNMLIVGNSRREGTLAKDSIKQGIDYAGYAKQNPKFYNNFVNELKNNLDAMNAGKNGYSYTNIKRLAGIAFKKTLTQMIKQSEHDLKHPATQNKTLEDNFVEIHKLKKLGRNLGTDSILDHKFKFRGQVMTLNSAIRQLRIDTTRKVRPHLAQQQGMVL